MYGWKFKTFKTKEQMQNFISKNENKIQYTVCQNLKLENSKSAITYNCYSRFFCLHIKVHLK